MGDTDNSTIIVEDFTFNDDQNNQLINKETEDLKNTVKKTQKLQTNQTKGYSFNKNRIYIQTSS